MYCRLPGVAAGYEGAVYSRFTASYEGLLYSGVTAGYEEPVNSGVNTCLVENVAELYIT